MLSLEEFFSPHQFLNQCASWLDCLLPAAEKASAIAQ
jgi:hypothetical protein